MSITFKYIIPALLILMFSCSLDTTAEAQSTISLVGYPVYTAGGMTQWRTSGQGACIICTNPETVLGKRSAEADPSKPACCLLSESVEDQEETNHPAESWMFDVRGWYDVFLRWPEGRIPSAGLYISRQTIPVFIQRLLR